MKERITGHGKVVSVGMTDQEPVNLKVNKEASGNASCYSVDTCPELEENQLTGKIIYWLGSSVTYGFASCGEAVADFMAKRNGLTSVKSTISGTTLADIPFGPEEDNPWQVRIKNGMQEGECRLLSTLSYLTRLDDFPKDIHPDLFVIQLSTNDSSFPMKAQGIIADGFDEKHFDPATTFGAIQLILARIKKYWGCPVLIYTSPLLDIPAYKAMVAASRIITEKWGAYLLDLNADQTFNALGKAYMEEWMNDLVHPLCRGYLEWWTPRFEEVIREILL